MAQATLLDIAKLNGNDKLVGLIEENLAYAPEVGIFPMRTIRGTSYDTVVRTGFPGVGFRAANAGFTPGKSTFDKRHVETFVFGGVIAVDKAVAQAYEDGSSAFEMIEADGVAKNALIKLGSQIWYGVTTDALGFPGIKSLTPFGGAKTLDATGSTATTASSVYFVKFGTQNVTLVAGQNGSMTLSDFTDQQLVDPNDSAKLIPSRVADLTAWTGLQVGNVNSVARICNLTAQTGKTLTDALLSQAIALLPVGYVPDAIFMSRRSRAQLQTARTPILNVYGGGAPGPGQPALAPLPTSFENIPIIATDSILNTDAIET